MKTIRIQHQLLIFSLSLLFSFFRAYSAGTIDTLPGVRRPVHEFSDIILLGPGKNTYVDIKGTTLLSADVGGSHNVKIAVQENSSILKLRALRKNFEDANMMVVCQDTILMYLIRYVPNPEKTYYSYNLSELRQRVVNLSRTSIAGGAKVEVPMTPKATASGAVPASVADTFKVVKDIHVTREPLDSLFVLDPFFKNRLERVRTLKQNMLMGDNAKGIDLELTRLYFDEKFLYVAMSLSNRTNVDFAVQDILFELHTPSAIGVDIARKLPFLQASSNDKVYEAGTTTPICFALPKLPLAPEEKLVISIWLKSWDKHVSRKLELRLAHKELYRAWQWDSGLPLSTTGAGPPDLREPR